jgi:hypothetical protein
MMVRPACSDMPPAACLARARLEGCVLLVAACDVSFPVRAGFDEHPLMHVMWVIYALPVGTRSSRDCSPTCTPAATSPTTRSCADCPPSAELQGSTAGSPMLVSRSPAGEPDRPSRRSGTGPKRCTNPNRVPGQLPKRGRRRRGHPQHGSRRRNAAIRRQLTPSSWSDARLAAYVKRPTERDHVGAFGRTSG